MFDIGNYEPRISFRWKLPRHEYEVIYEQLAKPLSLHHRDIRAVGDTLVQVVISLVTAHPGAVRYSCDGRRYMAHAPSKLLPGQSLRYTLEVIGRLNNAKLIEDHRVTKGTRGRESTMHATDKLCEMVRPALTKLIEEAPKPPLILKYSEAFSARTGRKFKEFSTTPTTDRMIQELDLVNELLLATSVELDAAGPDARYKNPVRQKKLLYRIFNVDWSQGGRAYGPALQHIPRRLRPRLLINNEHVAVDEPDWSASHAQILLAAAGIKLTDDPYTLHNGQLADRVGGEQTLRVGAKLAFQMLVNTRSREGAVFALKNKFDFEQRKDRAIAANPCLPHGAPAIGLADADRWSLLKRHACEIVDGLVARLRGLEDYFFHGDLGRRLQKIESDAMMNCLVDLARENIPALPVFDSIVAAARHRDRVVEVMAQRQAETLAMLRDGRLRLHA